MRHLKRLNDLPETTYLREFVAAYGAEIAWTPEAEEQMRHNQIFLPQLRQALKTGRVLESEKEDACGAKWIVIGVTCEDEYLELVLEVFCDRNHICILSVEKC